MASWRAATSSHGGRRQQPVCEKIFAGARSSHGQQLKQRTFAEQIEIFGIDVAGIAEAFAHFARSHPAVFQARQATLVELDGALGALQPFHHARVDDHQNALKPPAGAAATRRRSRPRRRRRKPQPRRPMPAARRALPMRRNCFSSASDAARRSARRAWYSSKGLTMLG